LKRNNTVLILILIVAIVLQGIWIYSIKNAEENTVITHSTVLESIQSIGELNTLEMYFHDIVEFTENKTFRNIVIPFTTKSFIFTIEARVKAGVNLSNIEIVSLDWENKEVELRMPEYSITSIEFISFNPFSENDALFNRIRNEDLFLALENFTSELETKAISLGILDKASESGVPLISQLVRNLGFETIIIN